MYHEELIHSSNPKIISGVWLCLIAFQCVAPEQLFCRCTRVYKEAVTAGEVSQAVGR